MKTYFTMAMLCLMASPAFSQILFEEGYFIENSGNRVDCLIRNVDWKNNPDKFRYKLSMEGESKMAEIADISSFGISDFLLFERHTVAIDRRSYLAADLNQDRNPGFREEQLFLKLLVNGKAKLYAYEDGNLRRYFYSVGEAPPKQLVYTRYKSPGNKILDNFFYKSQLGSEVKCEALSSTVINSTAYTETDLISYFVAYNECSGDAFSVYQDDSKTGLFHLNLRPGIDYASLDVRNTAGNSIRTEFENQLSFRMGLELEVLLPFNRNKWALTLEPFYRSFKTENADDSRADYKSLVASIGVRHYFFINESSKLFLNGNFGMEFPLNSELRVNTLFSQTDLEIRSSILDNYWAVGMGYNWRNKYSAEVRYNISQDLLVGYDTWRSDFSGVSLLFGYTIL